MQSFLDDPPAQLIARLARIERLNNETLVRTTANRAAFEFDAIDARLSGAEAVATVKGGGERSRLAVIKILTTALKFARICRRRIPLEGDWFYINLEPRGQHSGPYAWASALGPNGYLDNRKFVIRSINWLLNENEPPFQTLNAEIPAITQLAQEISSACRFPRNAIGRSADTRKLLMSTPHPQDIFVHDVGQASFTTLRDKNSNAVAHLDAGWPISYNLHTASNLPSINNNKAPVILSHWDWDHLHGYHVVSSVRSGIWIAPIQKLGPGASFIANSLAANDQLYGLTARTLTSGAFTLGRCRGKRGDLNNTGLWAWVALCSKKSLLYVGDAEYDLVAPPRTAKPDFLVVTHHGAEFNGGTPAPSQYRSTGVVSVGARNTYRHPSSAAIARHEAAGWHIIFTCAWGAIVRGGRKLGP